MIHKILNQAKKILLSHLLHCLYFIVCVCLCYALKTHGRPAPKDANRHFDYFPACGVKYYCLGFVRDSQG